MDSARSTDKKRAYITHRKELTKLASAPYHDAESKKKLAPPDIPEYCMYIWRHFWDMYEVIGDLGFTLADVIGYKKVFAPGMSSGDIAVLIRLGKHAESFVRKMRDGEV